jgi:hypothetical protein
MPISTAQVTLSNVTPTEIVGHDNMPHLVTLHNMTKSSNNYVHLGDASMTLLNSIHIDPGETLQLTLQPGDRLFAMSDPNGLVVGVMDIRKSD